MSAHPFGPTPHQDVERLQLFSIALSTYKDARSSLLAYEAVRSEVDPDDPYLLTLELTKVRASEMVKAQALILSAHGVFDRCIHALEARN